MEVFKYFGSILLKDEASKGLDKVESRGKKLQKGLGKVGSATTKTGKAMSKWVTGPIAAATVGIVGLVSKTGDHADRLLDLSDITGLSTDAIQEWQYVAGQAGVSTEFATKAIEGMTKKLPNIEKGSGPAAEAIEGMGISLDDFMAMSNDDRFELLVSNLAAIEDEIDRNAKAASIFGGAWKDLAPVLGMGGDTIADLRNEAHDLGGVIANDALQDANEYRQEMEKVKTVLQGAAFEMGSKLAPVVTTQLIPAIQKATPLFIDLVEKVSGLVDWFMSLSPETQKFIGIAGGLMMVLGPALIVIGKITTGISALILVFTKLSAVIKIVRTAQIGLNLAMLSNPIFLVIAAIVALITIGVLLYKNWDTIKEYLSAAWEWLKTQAVAIWEGIKGFFKDSWEWIKTQAIAIWEGIKGFFTDTWEGIKNFFVETWEGIKQTATRVWDSITAFFKKWGTTILKVITGPIGFLVITIIENWDKIRTKTIAIFNYVKGFLSRVWSNIKSTVKNAVNNMKNTMSNVWERIKSTVSNAWTRIRMIISNGLSRARSTITGYASKFLNAGKALLESLTKGIKKGIKKARDAVKDGMQKLRNLLPFSPAKEGPLSDLDKSGESFFPTWATGVTKGIRPMMRVVSDGLTRSTEGIFGKLAKTFSNSGGALGKYFKAILEDGDYLNDWLTHLPKEMKKMARYIGERAGQELFPPANRNVPAMSAMSRGMTAASVPAPTRNEQTIVYMTVEGNIDSELYDRLMRKQAADAQAKTYMRGLRGW